MGLHAIIAFIASACTAADEQPMLDELATLGVELTAPSVTKLNELTVATNASTYSDQWGKTINGQAFQQDAITSLNGWQYVAYYIDVAGRPGVRQVAIARRKMDVWVDGEWQPIVLTDYDQTTNDTHNTISIGISPNDGTIHLAFDMHACQPGRLNQRRSIEGVAAAPQNFRWSADLFEPVSHTLGNVTIPSGSCGGGTQKPKPTYPRFVTTPQGDLLLSLRLGSSGDGDEHLYRYTRGVWTDLGKYIEGGSANPYLHGLDYDRNGRLHATWMWREESSGPGTNHDLLYAYSDDNGVTWRNNDGSLIRTSGRSPVSKADVAFTVVTIPQNSGLLNSEGQAVDRARRVHVLTRHDVSGTVQYVHYFRGVSDGRWNRRVLPIRPGGRGKIVAMRKPGTSQDDVYAILPGRGIASASLAETYKDWALVDTSEAARFLSDPLYDRQRLADKGLLSIIGQQAATIYSQDWLLGRDFGVATP